MVDALLALDRALHIQSVLFDQVFVDVQIAASVFEPLPCVFIDLLRNVLLTVLRGLRKPCRVIQFCWGYAVSSFFCLIIWVETLY